MKKRILKSSSQVTSSLMSTEQCVQSARKAQSLLGMVKRHFKVIDKEDFNVLYKTYIRYSSIMYRRGLLNSQLKKDRIQHRATKMVKGLKRKPYEVRLKALGLYSTTHCSKDGFAEI